MFKRKDTFLDAPKAKRAGPKALVQHCLTLGYEPKIHLSIALNGDNPEVRIESPDCAFFMTGEEFIAATSKSTSSTVRLEATEDGSYRLARYYTGSSGTLELDPSFSVIDLHKNHMAKLKETLRKIQDHVTSLINSKEIIKVMFQCIVDVYRKEQQRFARKLDFYELSRLVESYVSPHVIVQAFIDKVSPKRCHFNHYNLCTVAMSQGAHILSLIDDEKKSE